MKCMLIRRVTISASIHWDWGEHKIAACQSIPSWNRGQHTTWQPAPLGSTSRKIGSISCQISSHCCSTFPPALCSCGAHWVLSGLCTGIFVSGWEQSPSWEQSPEPRLGEEPRLRTEPRLRAEPRLQQELSPAVAPPCTAPWLFLIFNG